MITMEYQIKWTFVVILKAKVYHLYVKNYSYNTNSTLSIKFIIIMTSAVHG